jgi:hypothetical protein
MAINYNTVAGELFNQLVGVGNNLQVFDKDGKRTLNSEDGRKFYSKNNKMLVSIDEETNSIQIKFGPSSNKALVDKFVSALKDKDNGIAKKYILGVDVMPYSNKDIEPKNLMAESLSAAMGSVKTSYQQTEGAKLIIRHNNPVNEEIRGSRSRHIKALFIENSQGERFKYPFKHLLAARTMTQHVAEGGTPYDELGSKIVSLSEERERLLRVASYIKTNGLQEQAGDIGAVVKGRLDEIKTVLNKYNPDALRKDVYEDDTSEVENLKEKLTKNVFDESIQDMLPKLGGYLKAYNQRQAAQESFNQLQQQVEVAESIAVTALPDTELLDVMVYESPTVSTTELINMVLPVLEDEQLKANVTAVSEYVQEGLLDAHQVENLTRSIIGKAQLAQESLASVMATLAPSKILESAFSKYSVREVLK